MLQTGTLYLPANNENAVEINRPLPNIFLYFSRNGDRVITTKTDEQGKFSFDLPLGSYQVTMSLGPGSQILPLCAGALFELKSNSAQNAFEKWVLSSIYIKPEENPFVIMLKEIAQEAKNSAVSAKTSAESAEKTARDFNENTVGSGRVMKEGAYGLGKDNTPFSILRLESLDSLYEFMKSGGFRVISPFEKKTDLIPAYSVGGTFKAADRMSAIFVSGGAQLHICHASSHSRATMKISTAYTTSNTTVDSNGFIKAASPIIKLFDTHIEANDSFKEEPIFEKISAGVYRISNTLGLAKIGWYIEIPKDRNSDPLFNIEWSQDDDNTVTIRTYKRREMIDLIDDGKGNLLFGEKIVINGDPVDINEGRFVTLRFHEEPEEIVEEIVEEEQSGKSESYIRTESDNVEVHDLVDRSRKR